MRLIELYKFAMGSTIWTYTSGNESLVYNSETYLSKPMGRGKAEIRNELSKATLEVRLDILDDLSTELLTNLLDAVLSLTLYVQDQETTTTSIAWKGRLSSIKPVANKLVLNFESVFTSLRRPGLRARYQKTCRHVLYHGGCGLDIENFGTLAEPTNIVSNVVTVPAASGFADGWFFGGALKAPNGAFGFIVEHVGSSVTLQKPIPGLATDFANSGYGENYGNLYGGVGVTLYPGCDHTRQTCLSKFNNLNNYGGFPWIPSRNPFDGSSIV